MIQRRFGISGSGLVAMLIVVSACSGGSDTTQDAPKTHETEVPAVSIARTATLGASCSGCHAEGGQAIRSLSGLSHEALIDGLTGYRDAEDGTTVMHRLARGYTDEEITAIADYLTNKKTD